ncbi:P-loop NTPase [Paludisphaera sp.]|uniref:exopolysaccharide transport family protein n=1 Tax=Paludisphaera sp. TaxID=2017432 RepID=UPI00301D9C05
MDTSDRLDPFLPARVNSPQTPAPRLAGSFGGGSRELAPAGASTMHVDPVGIFRGLLRNWWKILGLWLIASAPLLYLIYTQVKPKYTAYSRLRIQPTQYDLFGGLGVGRDDRTVAIQTEIEQMRTDRVLDTALADARVSNLPFVRDSKSPRVDLRKQLKVVNDRNTNQVTVSLESPSPEEAAAIVNAVVAAYLDADNVYKTGADEVLMRNFRKHLDEMQAKRKQKEDELARLIDSGVDSQSLVTAKAAGEGAGEEAAAAAAPGRDISQEHLRSIKGQLLDVQVQLITARSRLESRTRDYEEGSPVEPTDAGATLPDDVVMARVEAAFRSDPAIDALYAQKGDLERRLAQIQKGSRRLNDPARVAHEGHLQEVKDEIDSNWRARYHALRREVLAAGDEPPGVAGDEPRRKTVEELREEVKDLERIEESFLTLLAEVDVESKQSNSATYRAQFLQNEISSMAADEKVVSRKLQDLMFRTNRELVRVELVDPAVPDRGTSDDKRVKLMAAAPLGVLALIVGLFALLEVRAERVGDPDALSTRVQSQVYSLPPIPMARSPRRLGAPGEDDQIDRFIQRLDHLRFAVCGDQPDAGLGRCVLISSAVGGEGKTTLAAQLAARCGHAGHSTLLIDADLRRGALCPLLDVADGPGLSDVLTNEVLNVEDLTIPVQGGTFHLLSAGTPTSDTSRVFQGRTFGMLIARLRQLYDLIIIDSPPILPVPDALIMGRWTDGVVLTSRFDVSRAPQVERARRQLDLAGIPVLGTVINGMRTSDSYYGRYSYSRQQAGPGDPGADATPTS